MIESDASWRLFDTIKSIASSNGQSANAMATCVRVLSDGTRMMQLVGSSILTPLNGSMAAEISQGDMAEVRIEDGVMSLTANVSNPSVGQSEVNDAVADKATVRQLGESNARIEHLEVTALTAESATIANLQADTAKVHDLTADQLTAATAYVGALDAGNVTAAQLIADHATVGALDSTYAKVDIANVNNAWISNGTIKDAAISDGMINSVSANKLTAGTIDASKITVSNLNADNITAGTINGQRIGQGSLSLDKLSEDVYTESEVDTIVDGLNDRIDGAIETYTGTTVPTLNNSPASSWNTTKLRDEHVGDVYYVVNSQSQQNGYCYRFTKSGSTYSWQLIKDSDVTAALSRLTTAEGKITTFDSDISKLKTDTGTLTTKTESLETRMSDAEADILDKVDTTTFNEVSDTVDSHSQSITQMTTTLSNKADSSTVTAVTNRVSKNEQDISGINTTIGELQDTVKTKADGSTVSTISNKLNTVSDTVDGHTQTISSVQNTLDTKADSSTVNTLTTKVNTIEDTVDGHTSQLTSITSTQTTMQGTLNKTVKSSIQLWYSKANTTAPSKPTSQVTSTSTAGNAWRIVVPAYNASYPNYYYCWQYEYTDGTYGWSAVVRDIAMGESQSTARTADSNASAAVTTANTASTNASTALTTANTANTNASEAKTAATTASTTASEAKTTAETAASDASTAKTNAASAVSTANSASTTATNAQNTANANIKSSVQLWFTKANSTAPSKPTSVVSTSNANTANAWNLVVPVWNKNYPHYFYCYQQQKGDGNYQWTDVVYDRATSEAQQLANTTSTSLTTLQEDYATYKQTTTENVSSIGTRLTTAEGKISSAETAINQNKDAIALRATKTEAYQVAQPNLTPYFSMPITKNSDDYWYSITSSRFTQLDDGWAHFECNNTGSSTINNYINLRVIDTLTPGGKYTLLAEFRNVLVTGSTSGNFYSQQSVQSQIWGASDATGGFTIYNSALANLEGGTGVFYKSLTTLDAESKDPSGTVRGTLPKVSFMSINQQVVAGQTISYDVRLSLYEGEYTGPYKPYTGPQLYATNAELKVTADGISSTVERIGGFKYLESTSAGAALTYIKTWAADGYSGGWTVKDLKNARVGDSVYIKILDSTRNCDVYVKGTITSVKSANFIQMTSHGYEDVLPVETIKSTINQSADNVKIQARHIEIDGTAIFTAISSDVDEAITDKGYQTSSQVESAITSKGYATTTQAQGYASTAQSNAISAAAADATTKANTAKSEAISAAATDATNKANTAESNAKSYADAIEIGGRNLFKLSDTLPSTCWALNAATVTNGVASITKPSSGDAQVYQMPENGYWTWEPSTAYVASIDARTISGDGKLSISPVGASVSTKKIDITTEWKRYEYAFVSSNRVGTGSMSFYNVGVADSVIECRYPKLERGNRATDWTPAPEDVSSEIDGVRTTANAAAPKANAVKRTQRIWYRTNASSAPATPGTASSNWVTKADDGNDAWTKMHIAISSTHKYIYTCEQYEMANGTVGYTSVLLDNTITVIDGGNIITGSVTANKLNAADINASKTLTVGAMTDAAASTILNSNVVVGGRNLLRLTQNPQVSSTVWYTAVPMSINGWMRYANAVTLERKDNGIKATHNTSSTDDGFVVPLVAYNAVTGGESLSVSFEYRTNMTSIGTPYLLATTKEGGTVGNTPLGHSVSVTKSETEWAKFSAVWTFPTVTNKVYAFLLLTYVKTSGGWIEIKDGTLKLEKGNKATDWTPAPEDVAADIATAQATANAAAPKANAVARSQRIYYRKTSSGAPAANTTWLATSGTGYGNWSLKVPPLTTGTGASVIKYPYLYTAVQTQTVAQQAAGTACSCSAVLIDDSSTVIDGGNIITGTVSANAINAASGTFDKANIPTLTADHIKANVISAVNKGTGTINANKINADGLTIGYSQIENPPTIPSTVAELSDASDYAKQSALTTEINQRKAAYATSSTAAGTQAKAATCANFALYTGASVTVTFSNANTHATPTLNVNSTGAKSIRGYTGAALTAAEYKWAAGAAITFVYDGSYWRMQDGGAQQAKADAANAACTATNYISATTAGIKIANANPSTATTYQLQTATGTDFVVGGGVRNRINADGMTLYDGNGTADANILASFLSTGSRIGMSNKAHLVQTGLQTDFYGEDGTNVVTSIKQFANDGGGWVNFPAGYGLIDSESESKYAKIDLDSNFSLSGGQVRLQVENDQVDYELKLNTDKGLVANCPVTFAKGLAISGINFGTGFATTNSNGITTFNPGLGVVPTVVFVTPGPVQGLADAAQKAIPTVWSIDSATQVQVRWQNASTNAWLANTTVSWFWIALYRGPL